MSASNVNAHDHLSLVEGFQLFGKKLNMILGYNIIYDLKITHTT